MSALYMINCVQFAYSYQASKLTLLGSSHCVLSHSRMHTDNAWSWVSILV